MDLLSAIKTRLQENTDLVAVQIGETITGLSSLEDSAFPRVEFAMHQIHDEGYFAQRLMRQVLVLGIEGYTRRATDTLSDTDLGIVIDLATWVKNRVYAMNSEHEMGSGPIPGFVQVLADCKLMFDYEHMPRTASFLLVVKLLVEGLDTNN